MPTKDEVAERLAQAHYIVEPGIRRIFRVAGGVEAEANPREPIKLLEVNENTVPSGIVPVHFGPHPASGVPFSSQIIEITPEEFERLGTDLQLPEGWRGRPLSEIPAAGDG